MTRANNWRSIGRISWRMASFRSYNVGVCECKHAISNTPKEKNHTLKDRESEGATAHLRNGKWGARETCFEQWSLNRLQCALWPTGYWSGQPRGKECRQPRPPQRPTYWVLPIQKMPGSRGSLCTTCCKSNSCSPEDGRRIARNMLS